MRLFNFGKKNRMSIMDICDDADHRKLISYWISGRIFGKLIHISIKCEHKVPVFEWKWLQKWNSLIDPEYKEAQKNYNRCVQ